MNSWSKKRAMMRRYDTTAHLYDVRYAEEQLAKINAALKTAKIVGNGMALDVGCGTGLLFIHVAGKTKALVGLDISRRTLQQAKIRAKDYLNVHLILADADYMPLRGNSFDNVFAFTLLQNTPNPATTLNELYRVARKEAVITVTGLKKSFALLDFQELLQKSDLSIVALEGDNLQCYVAVCIKLVH
jgi:ubiquinone/menaquinone biosynthesis C-methylase UbiE